jgi:hypothetical protein
MQASLIREISALRKNEFFKTLAMLRAQFNLHIMEAATHNQGSVMLEIPQSYVGRDPYDPIEMGKAVVDQLRQDGYIVTGTYLRFTVAWDVPTAKKKKKAKATTTPTMAVPLIRVPKA